MAALHCLSDGLLANVSQIRSDFVRQHLLQSQSEKVRSIPTVRSCSNVAAHSGRPSWPSMAHRTAIRETGTDCIVRIEITYAIAFVGTLSLRTIELPLEELAAATHRTKRVTVDDVNRRVRSHNIAASGTSFLLQRLGNTRLGCIWRHRQIRLLSRANSRAGK